MNPRIPWLALFLIVNVIAALIIYNTGELIGDLSEIELHSVSALFWATCLVIASFLVVLGLFFDFISKIRIRQIAFRIDSTRLGRRIGIFLLILQLLYLVFNLASGVNIAGSNNERGNSSLAFVWILVPVDMLFMIYYGLYRDSRYFYPNLAFWLASNLLRGWTGVFLTVIFLEWCRTVRGGQFSPFRFFTIGVIVLLSYPLLSNLKWIIRSSAGAGLSVDGIIDGFSTHLEATDYWNLVGYGINHIIGRLQSVAYVVDVMRLSDFLQDKFATGDFVPFWMEGLHGIIYERVFYGARPTYIGVAYTSYQDFGFAYDVGDWNVSLGYVSWFFIAPYLIPLYILYTFLLGFISFFILRKIGVTELSKDMLWYAWLVYLMAPWFATFVGFIYAMFVFLVIQIFFSSTPSVRFNSLTVKVVK